MHNVARLPARDLSYFQIWRTTGNGPKGQLFDYTWTGSRYDVGGPYAWQTTQRADEPWKLPIDDEERLSYPITATGGGVAFPGRVRELHHYNAPDGERHSGARPTASRSPATRSCTRRRSTGSSSTTGCGSRTRGRTTSCGALDPEFRAFQVFRGKVQVFEDSRWNPLGFWQLSAVSSRRSGTATHIDTSSGVQAQLTWTTD